MYVCKSTPSSTKYFIICKASGDSFKHKLLRRHSNCGNSRHEHILKGIYKNHLPHFVVWCLISFLPLNISQSRKLRQILTYKNAIKQSHFRTEHHSNRVKYFGNEGMKLLLREHLGHILQSNILLGKDRLKNSNKLTLTPCGPKKVLPFLLWSRAFRIFEFTFLSVLLRVMLYFSTKNFPNLIAFDGIL